MYNEIFFTNVLRLLDERGMSKTDLAQISGVSISFLSDLTNGDANPSLKVMQAIAGALETPLPTLLEMTDLDRDTLDELAGGQASRSLPKGLFRVCAILTGFQAYKVSQWDWVNRMRLKQEKKRTSKN